MNGMGQGERGDRLDRVADLGNRDEAKNLYDDWAETYDAELTERNYRAPTLCARALARCAEDTSAPVAEFGCGTGLGGLALRAEGFDTIDGFDLSDAMLAKAAEKKVYRSLAVLDLAQPLPIERGTYANAAAIGLVDPASMPSTALDAMLDCLAPGGCLVFSLSESAAADGTIRGRVMELTDCGAADFLSADEADLVPEAGIRGTIYVLRKR